MAFVDITKRSFSLTRRTLRESTMGSAGSKGTYSRKHEVFLPFHRTFAKARNRHSRKHESGTL